MSLLLLLVIVLIVCGGFPAYQSGAINPMFGTILGIVTAIAAARSLVPVCAIPPLLVIILLSAFSTSPATSRRSVRG